MLHPMILILPMRNTRRAGIELVGVDNGVAYAENPHEIRHRSSKGLPFATSVVLCNNHLISA
jgi:hypothetical protein